QRLQARAAAHDSCFISERNDVRIVVLHVRTASGEPGQDGGCRRVSGILHVWLECDADDPDAGTLERATPVVESLGREVDDVSAHPEIDVPRELDEPVDEI